MGNFCTLCFCFGADLFLAGPRNQKPIISTGSVELLSPDLGGEVRIVDEGVAVTLVVAGHIV